MAHTQKFLTDEEMANRPMTVSEVAEYLRLDRKTVLKMCNDGRIKAVKVARDWRILKSEVDRILAGGTDTAD